MSALRHLAGALALLAALIAASAAVAVQPDEVLDDPALEERARALSAGLRCLVCQNQSIDDSDAPLARDLRILVRERLVAGDTDAEVIDFLVARYGDFILLKPPFNWRTAALWALPAVVFVAAVAVAAFRFRRKAAPRAEAPLSETEQRDLDRLLSEDRT